MAAWAPIWFDTAFVQQIFDIAWRQRNANVEHHCPADEFGARLEPPERAGLRQARTLPGIFPRLAPVLPDSARIATGR